MVGLKQQSYKKVTQKSEQNTNSHKYNKIPSNNQTSKKLRKLQKALDKNVLGGG